MYGALYLPYSHYSQSLQLLSLESSLAVLVIFARLLLVRLGNPCLSWWPLPVLVLSSISNSLTLPSVLALAFFPFFAAASASRSWSSFTWYDQLVKDYLYERKYLLFFKSHGQGWSKATYQNWTFQDATKKLGHCVSTVVTVEMDAGVSIISKLEFFLRWYFQKMSFL